MNPEKEITQSYDISTKELLDIIVKESFAMLSSFAIDKDEFYDSSKGFIVDLRGAMFHTCREKGATMGEMTAYFPVSQSSIIYGINRIDNRCLFSERNTRVFLKRLYEALAKHRI